MKTIGKKLFINHTGFTLIDLLVSLGIFGLITASVIANFHGGARNDAVRQAANLTAGLLRQAQTMTLTGAVLNDGTFPKGGYGVRFDINSPGYLLLFADKNQDNHYTPGFGEELFSQSVTLPSGAVFNLPDALDVLFYPPDGSVYFNGRSSPASQNINFTAPGSGSTKTLTIFRVLGQVRIQ